MSLAKHHAGDANITIITIFCGYEERENLGQ
jgi:hypothetical protein